jgi:hypothetical protein
MDVVIFAFGVRYAQEVGFMIGFVQLPTGYKTMAKFYFIFSTLLATSADDVACLPWGKIPNNYTLLFRKELILLKRLVLSKDMLCIISLAPNTIEPNTTKHKSCRIKYALKSFALLKKIKCITHQVGRIPHLEAKKRHKIVMSCMQTLTSFGKLKKQNMSFQYLIHKITLGRSNFWEPCSQGLDLG